MFRRLSIAAAALSGFGSAFQARINGELGFRIDDGIAAATISFIMGLALLIVIALLSAHVRKGLFQVRTALRDATLPPLYLLGGLGGAFFIACQGLTVATLGVAVFTISFVAGQLTSSLFVDRLGITPGDLRPVTPRRLISVAMGLSAVGIAVVDQFGDATGIGFAALTALAGVGVSWQMAVNGRLRQVADNTLSATLVSFVAGTIALVIIAALVMAIRGLPDALPTQPWLYLGGPLGVIFVTVAARVVHIIGVLLLGLATIAGQLVGAIFLDVVVPAPGQALSAFAIAGAIGAFTAVWIGASPGKEKS